jgi:hypothetical protein
MLKLFTGNSFPRAMIFRLSSGFKSIRTHFMLAEESRMRSGESEEITGRGLVEVGHFRDR